ncbi:MAG: DUF4252 domain-containing protein [Acidobacteriota bacterium]
MRISRTARLCRPEPKSQIIHTAVIIVLAAAIILDGTAFAGGRAPSAAQIRRAVEMSSEGCQLKVEESIRLGRFKMWAARQIVAVSGVVEPEVREILRTVRKLEVVTYRSKGESECRLPAALPDVLASAGWSRVMTEGSEGEETLVYQHASDSGRLDGLLVAEMSGNELEIVKVHGKIDRLMEMAVDTDDFVAVLEID